MTQGCSKIRQYVPMLILFLVLRLVFTVAGDSNAIFNSIFHSHNMSSVAAEKKSYIIV